MQKKIEKLIANNVLALLKWRLDPETELGLEPEDWPRVGVVGVEEAAVAIAKEVEKLRQQLTDSSYMVEDEHHEMWWTMPATCLDEIFAEFGFERREG